MPKLFAIAVLIIATFGATTAQTSDMLPSGVARPAAAPASPQLDPQRKMWFDHAVGHILGGDA